MFRVKQRTLLLIAGIVWFIAGFNVARLGILSYLAIERVWYWYLLSLVTFIPFERMLLGMTRKHTDRILHYEEKQAFWHFFDGKSYAIMACMMGGGIAIRALGLVPDTFIAFFYTGLGCALGSAGIAFLKNDLQYERLRAASRSAESEKTGPWRIRVHHP